MFHLIKAFFIFDDSGILYYYRQISEFENEVRTFLTNAEEHDLLGGLLIALITMCKEVFKNNIREIKMDDFLVTFHRQPNHTYSRGKNHIYLVVITEKCLFIDKPLNYQKLRQILVNIFEKFKKLDPIGIPERISDNPEKKKRRKKFDQFVCDQFVGYNQELLVRKYPF